MKKIKSSYDLAEAEADFLTAYREGVTCRNKALFRSLKDSVIKPKTDEGIHYCETCAGVGAIKICGSHIENANKTNLGIAPDFYVACGVCMGSGIIKTLSPAVMIVGQAVVVQ